jgi:hypothetical protein
LVQYGAAHQGNAERAIEHGTAAAVDAIHYADSVPGAEKSIAFAAKKGQHIKLVKLEML